MSSVAAMWVPLLFGFALFLSSALLFLVQPMVGRSILPHLGGNAIAWNACLVFFQAMLLASYVYADLVHRFRGLRWQPWLQILLMLTATILCFAGVFGERLLLELAPRLRSLESWPILSTLCLLIVVIGLPFFALAAVSPLLQRWFAHLDHAKASDPYFLFVASNLGGLSALILYALLIEPNAPLYAQWMSWKLAVLALGFTVFLAALSAWRSPRNPELEPPPAPADPNAPLVPTLIGRGPATWPRRFYWFLASAIPVGLMMGVTDYLTLDVAPAVILWTVPLALYLIAFCQAFGRFAPFESGPLVLQRILQIAYGVVLFAGFVLVIALVVYLRGQTNEENGWWTFLCGLFLALSLTAPFRCIAVLQPFSVLAVVLVQANMFPVTGFSINSAILLLHLTCFYWSARLCLGMLALDRPAAPALTTYFGWIGLGGLCGGLFQLLLAPLLFRNYLEYSFLAALACVLRPALLQNGVTDWLLCLLLNRGRAADDAQTLRVRRFTGIGFDVGIAFVVAVAAPALFLLRHWVTQVQVRPGNRTLTELLLYVNDYPLVLLLLAALVLIARPLRSGLALAAIVLFCWIGQDGQNADPPLFRERNAFGILRVNERTRQVLLANAPFHAQFTQRELLQGRTSEGSCVTKPPELLRYPTTYYHRKGPVGQVMRNLDWFSARNAPAEGNDKFWLVQNADNAKDDVRLFASLIGQAAAPGAPLHPLGVAWSEPPYAMIGMGTGTLFTYAHPYQWVDAYELNPAVIALSKAEPPMFHYFQAAQERNVSANVIQGDARRNLAKSGRDGFYQVIFVDAFNSDSIPVHLLTQEAIELYFKKLTPEGIICIHTSNRYVDLAPMLENTARRHNFAMREVHAVPDDQMRDMAYFSSTWVLLARNEGIMRKWLEVGGLGNNLGPMMQRKRLPSNAVWTDERASVLSVVHFDQGWPKLIYALLIMLLVFGCLLGAIELGIAMAGRRPARPRK